MEDFVTYNQAVKLKELGFNYKCNHYYCKPEDKEVRLLCYVQMDYLDEQYHNFNDPLIWTNGAEIAFSAPTLSQVQKWFFEEKKIYIEIYCTNELRNFGYELKFDYDYNERYCCQGFTNPSEALSRGIDDAIRYIEENYGKEI